MTDRTKEIEARVKADAAYFWTDERVRMMQADRAYLLSQLSAVTAERDAALAGNAWCCFHCGEVFTDAECAAKHFGGSLLSLAACQIKAEEGGLVDLIRKQEAELDRFRSEESASFREFYRLGAEHSAKVRDAEQSGYDKGLADGRALTAAAKVQP